MPDIKIQSIPDGEEHHFVKISGSFAQVGKSYLLAKFQCEKCGEIRNFAIAMTGYYVRKESK